jgi:hypothetical protein
MPGFIDSLSNMLGTAADAAIATGKYSAANAKMAAQMADAFVQVNQFNRGFDDYIGKQEALIGAYAKLNNSTLVLEKRNKDLQEGFRLTSTQTAKLAQSILSFQDGIGATSKQMATYAVNIKKMLPLYTQYGKENDRQYKGMLRIQDMLTTNMGLSAQSAEAFTLYTSKMGENADKYLYLGEEIQKVLKANAVAVAGANKDAFDTVDYMQQVIEGIASAGSEVQLQYGKLPGNLELATLKATALGFSLDDLAQSGEQLLNIESSIGDELEYQLLSGRRLVDQQSGDSLTNMYRQATLMGDMSKQADTLNTILEQEGDTLENNLFARQQMSKLLGIDEAQLSKALQKKKLIESDSNLKVLMNLDGTAFSDAVEKMKKQGDITDEQYKQLKKSTDTRGTEDILKQQLVLQFEQTALMKSMLTTEQAALVEANKQAILDDKNMASFQAALIDFGKIDDAAGKLIGRGTAAEVAATGNVGAQTLSLNTADLATSNVMAVTANNNATETEDVMIPPGGSAPIISAPAGTFVLDPQDTILAGTDPSLQNPTTVNDINNNTATTVNNINNNTPATGDNLSAVMMQVGRMIVAAINSKGSGVFGATTLNGPYYEG